MPSVRTFAILATLAVGAASVARADVVHLADDEGSIEGRIVGETSRAIVLEVEGGKIEIDRLKVASIERRPWSPRSAGTAASAPAPPNGSSAQPKTPPRTPPETATPAGLGGPRRVPEPPPPPPPTPVASEPERPIDLQVAAAAGAVLADKDGTVESWTQGLIDLGPDATPALAALLAEEKNPTRATALGRALEAYPSAVPAGRLIQALERRGRGATPALARAAAALGGRAGADAAFALAEECGRVPRKDDPTGALAALRTGALEGLALSGDARALETLLRSRDVTLYVQCALRALGSEGEAAAAAQASLLRALATLQGDALVEVVGAVAGSPFPKLSIALDRAYERVAAAGPSEVTTRIAIAEALGRLATARERAPDLEARRLLAGLVDDDDERVRLAAIAALARTGDRLLARRLIDAYERDPSQAVRLEAHAALVRLAGGRNLGDPEAWRAWAGSE